MVLRIEQEYSIEYSNVFTPFYLKPSSQPLKDSAGCLLLLQVLPDGLWLPFFDTFCDVTIYYMIRKEGLKADRFDGCRGRFIDPFDSGTLLYTLHVTSYIIRKK